MVALWGSSLARGLLLKSRMRRAFTTFSIVLPLALFSVGACGGSAFDGAPGAGAAGTGAAGTGATGTGGSGAFAGSSSGTAGRATGGSIGVAGSTGNAGTTSLGGSGNAGGTVGSAGTAGAGGADMRACSSNTDCEVVPVSCCGCGTGPVANYTAINGKYDAQYSQRCSAVDCAGCPPIAVDPNNPTFYYVPTCQAGRCEVVDLRTTDITACSSASDCSLRAGTACCPGCSGTPVALNIKNASKLSSLVCGSEPTGCLACLPDFSNYSAACSNGRCSVELGPCTSAHPCPL